MTQPFDRVARGLGMTINLSDEQIYLKHVDDLLRYATVMVGADNADDVVSTVFVRILKGRGLESLEDPRPYLFKAVTNEARSHLRRSRHLPLTERAMPTVDTETVDVIRAIRSLPPQQRSAVFFCLWEEHTIAEASELMGVRPGTVKRYIHEARTTLKGLLA